ncbi:MAG: bifunctional folylpolyglutamate synthase/dihydrofolate synthase [Candidatus Thermoplasmatota archaeon]|nr:bifunctional folylpolyglutamate synthase/dihydrofolate synthase [Candidatus Thermoplasmatota archaeon]MBS3790527.1 bifunctional folylpolyglutamate synthase/dihydrofolate synthase [Candidatus Thermoplasmatota archaeon]
MGRDEEKEKKFENPRDDFKHPEDYLYSLERIGVKLGLDKIEDFLSRVGDPQNDFKGIVVGGTNGKGSVCRALVNILEEGGYTTGLYLSPHLVDFEERIQINGENIDKEELWSLIEKVHPVVKNIEERDPEKRPSFFEVLTTLAFLSFSNHDVDFAVLEVGMGGRLDATNVAPHDYSVVTYVGYDHAEHLGDSKKKRAYEKGGIIAEGNYFVTGEKEKRIRDYFKEVCEEKNADFNYAFDRDYQISYDPLKIRTEPYGEIKIQGLTSWQAENALISLKMAEGFKEQGHELSERDIVEGIENTRLPGKMEFIKKKPRVMIDSAHNKTGFEALKHGLGNIQFNRLLLVVGMLEDKDYESMIDILGPSADMVYTAEPVSERKLDSQILCEEFESYCPSESHEHGIEALEKAEEEWREGDLIVVTGSMYLLGDILKKLR